MQKPSAPRRVLIIQLQHHGDVLLTTPMFSALKEQFPDIEIDVLAFAETAPMINAHPELSRILHLPRSKEAGRGLKRLSANLKLLWSIHQRKYDWVLHLNDRWPGAWAALVSRAATRASYEIKKRDNFVWRTAFPIRQPHTEDNHVIERNLAFLDHLGVNTDPDKHHCKMAYSESDLLFAKTKIREAGIEGSYILIHPTSRWFFKCWEDDRFAEVINSLAHDGHNIVLTAAPVPQEMALVENLMSLVKAPNVVSLAGKLTLPSLAAAIAGAKLFIGVDSAPMHMAAALNVPMVALFGPTKLHAWRPWSKKATVINAADYGPLIAPNDVDVNTTDRHLKNIQKNVVLQASNNKLSDGNFAK